MGGWTGGCWQLKVHIVHHSHNINRKCWLSASWPASYAQRRIGTRCCCCYSAASGSYPRMGASHFSACSTVAFYETWCEEENSATQSHPRMQSYFAFGIVNDLILGNLAYSKVLAHRARTGTTKQRVSVERQRNKRQITSRCQRQTRRAA